MVYQTGADRRRPRNTRSGARPNVVAPESISVCRYAPRRCLVSQWTAGALHAVTIRSFRRLANRSFRWNLEKRDGAETRIVIRAVPPL